MKTKIQYARPSEAFPDQPFFKWPAEHKFIVTAEVDPAAPALFVNEVQSWLWDRGERAVGWRTPRGKSYQHILVSIKNADTAVLFKLTFGGAA